MTIKKTGQGSAQILDVSATTRVMLPPGKKATESGLEAIRKKWTRHIDANGCNPLGYVYKLPAGLDPKDAVVHIAKRLPIPADFTWIDFTKFPDIALKVTDKKPAAVMPLLESLAKGQYTNVSGILSGVIPYLRKADTLAFGGIVTAHNASGETADRYDGEFLALVNTTSNEVLFLLDGNLFPGKFNPKSGF